MMEMLDKCHTTVTTLEGWAAVSSRGLLLPVPVSGDTWHVAAGSIWRHVARGSCQDGLPPDVPHKQPAPGTGPSETLL